MLHGRKHAVSALMFGTAALLSKPGQTLAPLVGTWLLASHTGVHLSIPNGISCNDNSYHLLTALNVPKVLSDFACVKM